MRNINKHYVIERYIHRFAMDSNTSILQLAPMFVSLSRGTEYHLVSSVRRLRCLRVENIWYVAHRAQSVNRPFKKSNSSDLFLK